MKYKVSLAILRPLKYEVEVEAAHELEAVRLAIKDFNYGEKGNIQPLDYIGDDELNLGDCSYNDKGELTNIPDGVHVESDL